MSAQGRPAADEFPEYQREEEHRAVAKLAEVGTAQADPATGQILRVNPRLCEITGYSEEELLSMTLAEITYPEDRQEDFDGYQQTVCGETSEYEAEKPYVRKDGQVVWVSVNATTGYDESGHPLRTFAVIQDITGHVQAMEGLRFLAEAGELLSSSLDYQATLTSVARLAIPR